MLGPDAMRAKVDAYLGGLRANDAEAILALYADGARVEDPIGSEPRVGLETLRAFYSRPLNITEVERLGPTTVSGSHAGFQFRIRLEVGGAPTELVITEFLGFDDEGKIVTMVAAPDFEAGVAQPGGKVYSA